MKPINFIINAETITKTDYTISTIYFINLSVVVFSFLHKVQYYDEQSFCNLPRKKIARNMGQSAECQSSEYETRIENYKEGEKLTTDKLLL